MRSILAMASSARTPPWRAPARLPASCSSALRRESLEIFGDKAKARALAISRGIAGRARHAGRRLPRRHQGVLRRPAQGLRHDDQGGGRRRRPRHARRAPRRRDRDRVRSRVARGAISLRAWRPLRRAADRESPPHRGADRRRRQAGGRGRRARLQPAAPPPEDRRDRAGTESLRTTCAGVCTRRRSSSARRSPTRASARSSSWSMPKAALSRSSRPMRGCRWSTRSPRR